MGRDEILPGVDLTKWHEVFAVTMSFGDLMLLYGQLSLAVRHPLNTGRAGEATREWINEFERIMLKEGFVTQETLRGIGNDEIAARKKENTE